MNQNGIKILVVDDEEDIVHIVKFNLEQEGYLVESAFNGVDAISKTKSFRPNLILLDNMMPYKNGVDTCKELRADPANNPIAIVFLTAKADEASEIEGLEIGADDYIKKPIRPKLLISRIQHVLKRITPADSQTLVFPDLEINRELFLVKYKGNNVIFPRKEFELIALLASKPNRVFLRNEILDKVWGSEVIVGDRTIDVHVRKIRQKLDDKYIHTVKGVGYKFEA